MTRGLRAPVHPDDREPELALPVLEQRVGTGSRGDHPNRAQAGADFGIEREQVEDVRPHRDEVRSAPALDRLGHRLRPPTGDRQDRGAEQQRHVDLEHRSAGMAVRREGDLDVALGVPGRRPELPGRVHERLGAVEDALGGPGGSAGREDQARLARGGPDGVDEWPVLDGFLQPQGHAVDRGAFALEHHGPPLQASAHLRQHLAPLGLLEQVGLEHQATTVELCERVQRQRWRDVRGPRSERRAGDRCRHLEHDPLPRVRHHREDEIARSKTRLA